MRRGLGVPRSAPDRGQVLDSLLLSLSLSTLTRPFSDVLVFLDLVTIGTYSTRQLKSLRLLNRAQVESCVPPVVPLSTRSCFLIAATMLSDGDTESDDVRERRQLLLPPVNIVALLNKNLLLTAKYFFVTLRLFYEAQ